MYNYNPYQQNYQQNYQQPMSLTRVTGIEGAKAFQMPINSVAALFDGSDDVFYLKSTDGAGFPTIRKFRFTEENSQMIQSEYVNKSEFDSFRKEITDYVKQYISEQQSDTANAVS